MNTGALADPVFRGYLIALAALLGTAGALLLVLRYVVKRNVEHAWKAYRGWLIMIPLVFVALFFGRDTTIVFFTLLGVGAFTASTN